MTAFYNDDDGNEVVIDGQRLRVPMVLMDSVRRALPYGAFGASGAADAVVRDARRRANDARDEMIRRAQLAWVSPLDARRKRDDDEKDQDDDDDDDDNNNNSELD